MLLFPKLPIETIFDLYDREEMLRELNTLNYFCFLRGRLNSYAMDGDEILVHIGFTDKTDLINKLGRLGIEAKLLQPGNEPGKQLISGKEVFIHVAESYFVISVLNSDKTHWFKVHPEQIAAAKRLENVLESTGLHEYVTLEGQLAYGRYINRYHYPELFGL